MSEQADTSDTKVEPRSARSWRELWQVPALLVAASLLLGGVATMVLTKPRPAVGSMIDRAEMLYTEGDPEASLRVLNDEARPLIREEYVTSEQKQRFHAARARSIAGAIRQLDLNEPGNHERVVNEFEAAEQLGFEFDDTDRAIMTRSLAALGAFDDSVAMLDEIGDESAVDRVSLRRDVLQKLFEEPRSDELIDEQLALFDADPMLSVNDRAWVVARQTERRLRRGFLDEAVARLLRVMPRVSTADPAIRGELFLLLGRSYAELGALSDARKQLDRAHDLIEPGDDLFATSLHERAKVMQQAGELSDAREHFEQIVSSYASSPVFLDALLSLAELLSVLAEVDPTLATEDDAIAMYSRFVDEAEYLEADATMLDKATASMLARQAEQAVRGELDRAAQYAQIAEDVRGLSESPASVLLAQARSNRIRAEELLADSLGDDAAFDLASVDPGTRAQAQRWFLRAGDYYRRHADLIAGGDDDAAYADSVWGAAKMFDSGGDISEAVASYIEFASTISDDPRLPEAIFRLGRAYQASGQYTLAAEQYESLLEIALDDDRGTGVGPYAVRSYVPLAEAYLEDADPENDSRATELLSAVLRGDAGGVDSEAFRDALAASGMVQYYREEYPRAIESLSEAVERVTDPQRLLRLRFLLADSYRLEAMSISDTLSGGAVAPSEQRRLVSTRESHLREAIEQFSLVRDSASAIPSARRTMLEQVYIRNSHFYLGDCAFDLGLYNESIRYYGVAKDVYADDAASLVALVQIFNAYLEMGEIDRAKTASERARRFYEALPETAWEDPTLPMTRDDWERWLDSTYELASLRAESPGT